MRSAGPGAGPLPARPQQPERGSLCLAALHRPRVGHRNGGRRRHDGIGSLTTRHVAPSGCCTVASESFSFGPSGINEIDIGQSTTCAPQPPRGSQHRQDPARRRNWPGRRAPGHVPRRSPPLPARSLHAVEHAKVSNDRKRRLLLRTPHFGAADQLRPAAERRPGAGCRHVPPRLAPPPRPAASPHRNSAPASAFEPAAASTLTGSPVNVD